jgi:hypothetical protein
MNEATLWQISGYILIAVGFVGSLLPLLPGPLLIWLGALVWAAGGGLEPLDWALLALLGLLALAAWGADIFFTTVATRRAGVSWKAIAGAIVGGIAGAIWLSGLAIVGALFGVLIGALLGLFLVETFDKRDWRLAWRGVRSYLAGSLLATAAEFGIALLMVGIFIARVTL